jgi:hypothetical protein
MLKKELFRFVVDVDLYAVLIKQIDRAVRHNAWADAYVFAFLHLMIWDLSHSAILHAYYFSYTSFYGGQSEDE